MKKLMSTVQCDACGKTIVLRSSRYSQTQNGVRYTYIKCKKCGTVYPINVFNEDIKKRMEVEKGLRMDIQKIADEWKKVSVTDPKSSELGEMYENAVKEADEYKQKTYKLTSHAIGSSLDVFRSFGTSVHYMGERL